MPDNNIPDELWRYFGKEPPNPTPADNVIPINQTRRNNGDELPDSWFINALTGEADELAHTSKGRNHRLNKAAWRLGGLLPKSRGLLTVENITDTLTAASHTASRLGDHPFTDTEIAASIKSGLYDGIAENPCPLPPVRERGHNVTEVNPSTLNVTEVNPSTLNGAAVDDGRHIQWITAADVQDAVPVWAWKYGDRGRIQLSTLALFAGRPGAGKSTAARWFAAQATLGHLEGCWNHQPQHVAYIATAEESARYTITPGLRAAGADLTRIHYPSVLRDGKPTQLLSTLDENNLLEYLITNHITVVIVDPLMSTITATTDINKNNETRAQIQPWARIADTINGIVIGVAHLRKNSTGDVVAAVTGSSAFGEVARAIFGFAKNMTDDTRVMSQHKNSTGYEDLSVTYQIESETVTVATGDTADVGKFTITGNSEVTVEDILSDSTMAGGANLECLRWLEDYLTQQGSASSKEAKAEAHKEIGASISSMDRAAKKLRVVVDSRGFPRRTYWSLPATVTSTDLSQSRQQSRHE